LGLRFGVKVAGKTAKRDAAQRLAEIMATHKGMQHDEKKALTASEAMAFFLRIFLRELKHAEKNRKAAPVRTEFLKSRQNGPTTQGEPTREELSKLLSAISRLSSQRKSVN
jgi:hypothetical protein